MKFEMNFICIIFDIILNTVSNKKKFIKFEILIIFKTLLFCAIEKRNIEAIRFLLEKNNIDINEKSIFMVIF